jgi:hypothetical protein
MKTHVQEMNKNDNYTIQFTRKLIGYSPRLLVGPPASHGYSSKVNHELNNTNSTLKIQNAVFTQF